MFGVYIIIKNIGLKIFRDLFLKGKYVFYIMGGNFFLQFLKILFNELKKKDEIFVCVYFNKVFFVFFLDLWNKGNQRDICWFGCCLEVV